MGKRMGNFFPRFIKGCGLNLKLLGYIRNTFEPVLYCITSKR
jgi:hypothetical protein